MQSLTVKYDLSSTNNHKKKRVAMYLHKKARITTKESITSVSVVGTSMKRTQVSLKSVSKCDWGKLNTCEITRMSSGF